MNSVLGFFASASYLLIQYLREKSSILGYFSAYHSRFNNTDRGSKNRGPSLVAFRPKSTQIVVKYCVNFFHEAYGCIISNKEPNLIHDENNNILRCKEYTTHAYFSILLGIFFTRIYKLL